MAYEWIFYNREIFKLVYTVLIGLICFIIVLKTDRLFRLSFHQGIRYFRDAFFFYGLAFITRYFLGTAYFFADRTVLHASIIKIVFEFFIIMAGFFLLYSLLWKKFETEKGSFSSLFNLRIILFYALTFVIVFLDYLWNTYCFMFVSQIILFIYASIISYANYKINKEKQSFLKMYFLVIILNLIAWLSNLAIATIFNWSQIGVINIYILNLIIFLMFLYSIINATKKSLARNLKRF